MESGGARVQSVMGEALLEAVRKLSLQHTRMHMAASRWRGKHNA